mmetsp:Transcript_30550/g.61919  ORF Transcript_30550/g.61919 Transcript_30550/m.61919 type:complete len:477 (+) Transcript_30550:27-1457(+)
MEERFRSQLARRTEEGTLRSLRYRVGVEGLDRSREASTPSIDFSSNDYLGLARCPHQLQQVEMAFTSHIAQVVGDSSDGTTQTRRTVQPLLGSTGSRLLSGDSTLAASLESQLAEIHNRPAALLFNSGYDANLSILGCSLMPGDVVVMDELCHNSLVMGVRMSRLGWEGGSDTNQTVRMFRHNNVESLVSVLDDIMCDARRSGTIPGPRGNILILVESVYSMDGDVAPLQRILDVAASRGASVVVDEAHGLGIYGRTNAEDLYIDNENAPRRKLKGNSMPNRGGGTGVLAALNLERHPSLLCSVHTFGKAAGCHGAVIAASETTVDYLINYARPFVYSTSPPPHALITIRCAYETILSGVGEDRRKKLFGLVRLFRKSLDDKVKRTGIQIPYQSSMLLPSPSPIQALLIPGNRICIDLCSRLSHRFDVYPIRSPTVPKGKERVRIIIHSHNSEAEVLQLVDGLVDSLIALSKQSKL